MSGSSPGVPVWPRPHFEAGGGEAEITLFVFSQVEVRGGTLPLRTRAHGVPEGGLPERTEVRTVARAEAPDWFDGFFTPALMALAQRDLGWTERPPVEATAVHVVCVTAEDPPDLRHLQAAWALARALLATGSFALLDAHAQCWLAPDSVLARADAPFRIADEVSVIFETEPTHGYGHLLHTRGLRKFGRPDLVLVQVPPKHGVRIADIVNQLAERLALGDRLVAGGTVALPGLGMLEAVPYAPGDNAPELHLNNAGLLLRPRAALPPTEEPS